jgi:hypothetical protein
MTWVKLVFLEALLRPVEQLDKRTPRGCCLKKDMDAGVRSTFLNLRGQSR